MDWIKGKSGVGYSGIKAHTSSAKLLSGASPPPGLHASLLDEESGSALGGHADVAKVLETTANANTYNKAQSPIHNRQEATKHRRGDSGASSAGPHVE